ncbi:kinase-like protein [Zopfia rhizophila CBS 207.26]|uniref:EKC/KEOPS complex subunit BUD32 n=1 Tax=Zopfia rhizophila CBS 207.26 TaxID=1314779 RepID=A0A6A6EXC9_9PEZI|nr:kinase-like protein [Zopfia rhizophila CBS 207.26]
MKPLTYRGSTSDFFRIGPGVIVKSPMKVWVKNPNHKKLEEEMERAISFERRVLEKLGSHPRIVPYLGVHAPSKGILLTEAKYGNLQAYIDSKNAVIDDSLRRKWAVQAAEAIVYVHGQGVIHSDLRPENYLVHATDGLPVGPSPSLDLWLCDFGGSRCDELGLNVNHLPDEPFFDPRMPWTSTPATDIFSLGSIFYTILTGHWPYMEGPSPVTMEAKNAYETQVNWFFAAGIFPDVSNLSGGNAIRGCWQHQHKTAEDVLRAIKSEMTALDK